MIASPERNRYKEYGSQGGGGHLIMLKLCGCFWQSFLVSSKKYRSGANSLPKMINKYIYRFLLCKIICLLFKLN
ncbi:hypothetical protein XNC1_0295 [Xenorhabdus nematophila ATCC 19061]|uniref:Uncharacterized protein n=1 Tax=Xenorhabdus nematophila (strain ATCC 19061 / DSM 3370 / CCUG 14189 / LMG 1036 / NCIMB 9965 / AN6) TaxID=406817 RepID=D3VHN9_XENNA|nr:hypothetical protein XNC1_0295 [Xenorhabdus nematophila ATCC 19061]